MKLSAIGNLPFKLVAAAVIITLGANMLELHRTNADLTDALTGQKAVLSGGQTVETQLNALAKGTRQLADAGNANAKRVVETLQANGVKIN